MVSPDDTEQAVQNRRKLTAKDERVNMFTALSLFEYLVDAKFMGKKESVGARVDFNRGREGTNEEKQTGAGSMGSMSDHLANHVAHFP